MRVFSICYRTFKPVLTGGPGGVNYRLSVANKKYNVFEKLVNIFEDYLVDNGEVLSISKNIQLKDNVKKIEFWLSEVDKMYFFDNENDIFIFHDVASANIAIPMFNLKKTAVVFHQQGTTYKEWIAKGNHENEIIRNVFNEIMYNAIAKSKLLAFPSKGAMVSVIESDSYFKKLIMDKNPEIVYNGCDKIKDLSPNNEMVEELIELMRSDKKHTFISVTELNEAKGVERIPVYLSKIKQKFGDIRWIVVGNGVKAGELERNIVKYGLEDNIYWIKERIEHNELMVLFENTDFYIMAHRYSIFDFAIIEAMSYGNIPVLTPVGGNFEMICEDNGIFINDLDSIEEFEEFFECNEIENAKQKNILVAESRYSEKAFLDGYKELANNLTRIG